MASDHMTDSVVEGVGDDLIYGLILFLICLIPMVGIAVYWYTTQRQAGIHPLSENAVENTRNRLREQEITNSTSTRENGSGPSDNTSNPHPSPSPQTQGRRDRTCPICIAEAQFGTETNCGHLFCGECVCLYWQHGNWLGAIRCPVCRQSVRILLLNFTEEEQQINSQEKHDVIQKIYRYNRRFSGEPISWIEYIRDVPTLLRHCLREFFSFGGLVWMFRLRIVVCFLAAMLYFISPLDIIPEAVFGFLGLLDDFFLLLLLGIYISIIYRRVLAERAAT